VPPVVLALSLIGVRGLQMVRSDIFGYNYSEPIARDTLLLPEAWIEDLSAPAGRVLKPLFDLVWNACGREGSPNFDADGNWIARQRVTRLQLVDDNVSLDATIFDAVAKAPFSKDFDYPQFVKQLKTR